MKTHIVPIAASLFALACAVNASVAAEPQAIVDAIFADGGKTPEVSTAYARKAIASKSAVLLDTRSRLEFDAGHIPGAVNLVSLTPDSVREVVNGDLQKEIILYCNGPFCQASRRAADALQAAGFSNVRRYQLGMPVWRALGGTVAVTAGGVRRVAGRDMTAIIIDLRSRAEFDAGSVTGAINAPAELVAEGKQKLPLPEDDFNTRVILVSGSGQQARRIAESLTSRPWYNVSYLDGDAGALLATAAR
jgi:rhodanese-related sulfurtransferase